MPIVSLPLLNRSILLCTVPSCIIKVYVTALQRTSPPCAVPQCNVSYRAVSCCVEVFCTLRFALLYCAVPHRAVLSYEMVYRTVLLRAAVQCSAHCTVLYRAVL